MADIRVSVGAGLVVLAGAVWYLWGHQGGTHTLALPEETTAEVGYWPYAWWCGHSRGNPYVHHYPDTIGPNVLPMILQTEDGTLSVRDSVVGRG